jgi:hypothetical protein
MAFAPDQDGCLGAVVEAEDRLVPLDGTFRRSRRSATMKDALDALLDRLFEHRHPARDFRAGGRAWR